MVNSHRVPWSGLPLLRSDHSYGMQWFSCHCSSYPYSWALWWTDGHTLEPSLLDWPIQYALLDWLLSLSFSWVPFILQEWMWPNFFHQWYLETWDVSHAVLGLITIVAIQRAIQKILISVFLTREFKHEETNRAWWTGKWYGRGLGSSAMSQPAREFIVKIVEMTLWSSDFLLGHILLIILTPPILIPFINRLHSTMLCKWILMQVNNSADGVTSLAPAI